MKQRRNKIMVVYFLEFTNSIKFFGENNNTMEIPKNEKTYPMIQKLLKNKKIILKNLLTK